MQVVRMLEKIYRIVPMTYDRMLPISENKKFVVHTMRSSMSLQLRFATENVPVIPNHIVLIRLRRMGCVPANLLMIWLFLGHLDTARLQRKLNIQGQT